MKKALLALGLLVSVWSVNAQEKVPVKNLVKTISLLMPRTANDDMPGTRGASVAWHPVQKKYYAAMAGNSEYPLAVFDATGKQLSADTANCNADIRGLWYNPKTKSLEGNTYGDSSRKPYGLLRFQLDAKGLVKSVNAYMAFHQSPSANSLGCLEPVSQKLLFYYDGYVYAYQASKGNFSDSSFIEFGQSATDGKIDDFDVWDLSLGNYNATTMVYTGIKGAEWGLLNYIDRRVELYDAKTHFLTRIYKLPAEASAEGSFNFAFCNNQFWFFDMESRTWTGYKM